jgi:hypothetical protein
MPATPGSFAIPLDAPKSEFPFWNFSAFRSPLEKAVQSERPVFSLSDRDGLHPAAGACLVFLDLLKRHSDNPAKLCSRNPFDRPKNPDILTDQLTDRF